MKSFFFVPATKIGNLELIKGQLPDEIIVDFEDAVLAQDREQLFHQVTSSDVSNLWFRVAIRNENTSILHFEFLEQFLTHGIRKFVIPKLASYGEYVKLFQDCLSKYSALKLILLVEHPRLMVELPQLLQDPVSNIIDGIGMGSHDLMKFIEAEHGKEQLFYPRMNLLYLAKAYNKMAIDIASMNIGNKTLFDEELLFGIENGFNAKFLIHPNQLDWLKGFDGVKFKRLEWAKRVMLSFPANFEGNEVEPFVLDGEVIEKPHVEKAQAILKQYKDDK